MWLPCPLLSPWARRPGTVGAAVRDQPSATAQRVAAFRLLLDRLPAEGGGPVRDVALARDVAAGSPPIQDERLRRHVRARTEFFDRVLVRALDRGVTQVLLLGAGYDGRALRYHRPGTRWWEVDHPTTQADKRARMGRLGIEAPHVVFVPFDLEEAGLADALTGHGLCPDAPTAICCEGVLGYLRRSAIERLLADCRAVAGPGTRLAASVTPARSAAQASGREALARAVGALGEPLSPPLDQDELAALLARTRWRSVDISERAQRAGFVVTAPVWAPPPPGMPDSVGALSRFADRMLSRPSEDAVAGHVAATYGLEVRGCRAPDLGVYVVELAGGRRWVARVHPRERQAAVTAEADLLGALEATGLPAERLAAEPAVSSLEGRPVVVTQHVNGRTPAAGVATFAFLGDLLGRLHRFAPEALPPLPEAGAWHHLVATGSTTDERAALLSLLDGARCRVGAGDAGSFDILLSAAHAADDGAGLPHAVVHADAVPGNLVGPAGRGCTLVDWSGAGWGPRLVSLGCLLWAAAAVRGAVEAAATTYAAHVTLSEEELARLEGAMVVRPAVLAGWTFATGRDRLSAVAAQLDGHRRRIRDAAPRARDVLGARQQGPAGAP